MDSRVAEEESSGYFMLDSSEVVTLIGFGGGGKWSSLEEDGIINSRVLIVLVFFGDGWGGPSLSEDCGRGLELSLVVTISFIFVLLVECLELVCSVFFFLGGGGGRGLELSLVVTVSFIFVLLVECLELVCSAFLLGGGGGGGDVE